MTETLAERWAISAPHRPAFMKALRLAAIAAADLERQIRGVERQLCEMQRLADAPRQRRAAKLRRYRARHPEIARAHYEVQRAIQAGTLIKGPCEVCGSLASEAHHDDYARPLDVHWLCRAHHKEADKKRKAAAR